MVKEERVVLCEKKGNKDDDEEKKNKKKKNKEDEEDKKRVKIVKIFTQDSQDEDQPILYAKKQPKNPNPTSRYPTGLQSPDESEIHPILHWHREAVIPLLAPSSPACPATQMAGFTP